MPLGANLPLFYVLMIAVGTPAFSIRLLNESSECSHDDLIFVETFHKGNESLSTYEPLKIHHRPTLLPHGVVIHPRAGFAERVAVSGVYGGDVLEEFEVVSRAEQYRAVDRRGRNQAAKGRMKSSIQSLVPPSACGSGVVPVEQPPVPPREAAPDDGGAITSAPLGAGGARRCDCGNKASVPARNPRMCRMCAKLDAEWRDYKTRAKRALYFGRTITQ